MDKFKKDMQQWKRIFTLIAPKKNQEVGTEQIIEETSNHESNNFCSDEPKTIFEVSSVNSAYTKPPKHDETKTDNSSINIIRPNITDIKRKPRKMTPASALLPYTVKWDEIDDEFY